MPSVLIRVRAPDPDAFRRLLSERSPIRHASGCRGARLFRNAADPTHAFLLMEWEDATLARDYCESDAVGAALAEVGAEAVEVHYLVEDGRV